MVEISRDGEGLGLLMFRPQQFAQLQKIADMSYKGRVSDVIDEVITARIEGRETPAPFAPEKPQPVTPLPSTPVDVRTIGGRMQKPSWLVVEMTDALAQFRIAIHNAGSLALLLISDLQREFIAHGRPVDFDFHEDHFVEGLYGLERDFFMNLQGQVQRFEKNHAALMSRLGDVNDPVMPIVINSRETDTRLMRSVGYDPESSNRTDLQNWRGAQTELIELVSALLNNWKGRVEGDFIMRPVIEALIEAEGNLFLAETMLHSAGRAVAQMAALSSEQKAAA